MQNGSDYYYMLGVLHSDGCIYKFKSKLRLNLTVGIKSKNMIEKFTRIFNELYGRTCSYRQSRVGSRLMLQTSINSISKKIKKNEDAIDLSNLLDLEFGAYLAGVIDGDGHIKVKSSKCRKNPQCMIRIFSDHFLVNLANEIEKRMGCKVHCFKDKRSCCYETCFYVSSKNFHYMAQNVACNLVLLHKKERLDNHIRELTARIICEKC